jgi:hypothetical protein
MWIVWPAFLMAGVLEIVVFAMVDPADLHWLGSPVEMSRHGLFCFLGHHHCRWCDDDLVGQVPV